MPRHRSAWVVARSVAVATVLLVAALARPTLADGPVAFEITSSADLLPGPAAAGQIGDYLLGNSDVTVIIEAPDHAHGDGLSGGNIVDAAAAPSWSDEIDDTFTLLVTWPRQAVYDTVWVESDGSRGTAVVATSGVDSENDDIDVTTRYILGEDERYVTIETTLTNHGAAVGSYVAGDAITASYDDNFAPGYGFDIAGETTITEWIGWSGTPTSYAYTIDTDNFLANHGNNWSDTFVYDDDLPSGASQSFTRYFAIGANGLSSASDIVNGIRDYPIGAVEGTVSDYFTGDPIGGATIDCLTYGTAHYTRILTGESGDFSATLPAASFDLQTNAEGYVRSVDRVTVSESVTSTLDITLWPTNAPIPKGDTLTVVMRPILSIPEIITPGGSFVIEAEADPSTTGWTATIEREGVTRALSITSATYDGAYRRWYLNAVVPQGVAPELYDLTVEASGGIRDDVKHAVAVRDAIEDDFYFVQITDTHLPTHRFYYQPGADSDTTEMDDLRAVIDDINLINPAFVLHTGDVVNEGELEDYLGWRAYTKAKRILGELEVPVYIVAGNHDVGGWDSTPPSDGTARRNWWSFFGWRSLYDPPGPDPIYTQNYTFDYGGAHFVGLEGYVNYDGWRDSIYGGESFTDRQMEWLADDLALEDPSAPTVLFYHYDFQHELDLEALGVDCALWGHIHETTGDIVAPPYDLSTGPVCDGRRLMRLVRVQGGAVLPSEPIAAGRHGEALSITYDPPNAGIAGHMTATILNQTAETFEHGLVKFRVPADSLPCAVTGGTLEQTIVEGDVAVCYARVAIAPQDTTIVAIEPVPVSLPEGVVALLKQNSPNPAQAGTTIRFVLAFPAKVRIDVFNIAGRRVRTLTDREYQAGESEVPWDLRNEDGLGVASGVYLYRLEAAGQSTAKKLAVIR